MKRPETLLLFDSPSEFTKRIEICAALVGNLNILAERTGISYQMLSRYSKDAEPSRDKLVVIAKGAGVNIEWLAIGSGPVRPIPHEVRSGIVETYFLYLQSRTPEKTADDTTIKVEFVRAYNNGAVARAANINVITVFELDSWITEYLDPGTKNDCVFLPLYDLDDIGEDSFTDTGKAAARNHSIVGYRRNVLLGWKLDPDKTYIFLVRNDDMLPTIRPNDYVICDCRTVSAKNYRHGIFVIYYNNAYMLRSIQFMDEGRRAKLIRGDIAAGAIQEEVVDVSKLRLVGRVTIRHERLR